MFLNEIHSLEDFLRNPWDAEVSNEGTVQIHVPKLDVFDTGSRIAARDVFGVGNDSVMEVAASSVSIQPKRLVLQKKVAEDFAANSGSGDLEVRFLLPKLVCVVMILLPLFDDAVKHYM